MEVEVAVEVEEAVEVGVAVEVEVAVQGLSTPFHKNFNFLAIFCSRRCCFGPGSGSSASAPSFLGKLGTLERE